MTKTTTVLLVMIGLSLSSASRAAAQATAGAQGTQEAKEPKAPPTFPPQYFVNVNVGAQPQRRTISATNSFPLYDETATTTTDYRIRNGVMYEIGAGYRLWPKSTVPWLAKMTLGVSFSVFDKGSTGTVDASIPDLFVFDRPLTVSLGVGELEHKERGIHVTAAWWFPVTEKIDVALSVGPSFIRVAQQVASVNVPAQTQTVNIVLDSQTGTAVGLNVGFDGMYMFTPRYGAGLFVRYAGGSLDLPLVTGLKVGGLQAGLGARLRF